MRNTPSRLDTGVSLDSIFLSFSLTRVNGIIGLKNRKRERAVLTLTTCSEYTPGIETNKTVTLRLSIYFELLVALSLRLMLSLELYIMM